MWKSAHEWWLPCWGFVEITERGGSPELDYFFHCLGAGSGVVLGTGVDPISGRKLAFVFDTKTKRSWVRPGPVYLPEEVFHFKATIQARVDPNLTLQLPLYVRK
jgi:hypothetical protein